MKKLILAFLILAFLPASSWAKTYTLSTSTALTGATTVPNGGVSAFEKDGVSGDYDLYPQLDRDYAYGFQLIGVSPSQAQSAAGGDWSGVSISVFAKFKSESDAVPWSAVEPVYFLKDTPVNSGDTPFIVWIPVPPADLARVYIETSGVTPIDLGQAKLIASQIPLTGNGAVVVIDEGYFDMPADGTGVSTFATDVVSGVSGVGYGDFSVSGSSVYTTADGTTTPAMSGIGQYCAANADFSLTGNEIRKLKLAPAITARRISYRLLNRDPRP